MINEIQTPAEIFVSYKEFRKTYPYLSGPKKIEKLAKLCVELTDSINANNEDLVKVLYASDLRGTTTEAVNEISLFFDCDQPTAREVLRLISEDLVASTTQVEKFFGFAGDTTSSFGIDPSRIKNKFEYWYLDLIARLMTAQEKDDRTNTGTLSTTFETYKHDLREYFPMIRSRFLKPENPGKEFFWMGSGSSNEKDLAAMGVPFWSEFADESGELGPVYGFLWRHWPNGDGTETDQVKYVLDLLKRDPNSRRAIIDCWHPTFIPDSKTPPKENYKVGKQNLTPCHYAINLLGQPVPFGERLVWLQKNHPKKFTSLYPVCSGAWVEEATTRMNEWNVPTHYLDLAFHMRSSDTVLGLPANFNFYATMCHVFGNELNMIPRYLCYTGMDVHLYRNHVDGMKEVFKWVAANTDSVFNEVSQFELVNKDIPWDAMQSGNLSYTNYDRSLVGPAVRFPVAVG